MQPVQKGKGLEKAVVASLPFRAGVLGWVACALALLSRYSACTCPLAWIPAPICLGTLRSGDTLRSKSFRAGEPSWTSLPLSRSPQGQADDQMALLRQSLRLLEEVGW